MDLKIISEALNDRKDISNVKVVKKTIFRDKEYQILVECDMALSTFTIPLVIAIPKNWKRSLIDIYIQRKEEFPFIPHIDIKGKICLFELEGILIDQNLYGIISQSLDRASKIIEEGFAGTNKEEFINEFDSYWIQLPHIRHAKCELPLYEQISLIKYSQKLLEKRKKETYIEFIQRSRAQEIHISSEAYRLNKYYQKNEKFIIKNALYIPVKANEYIFPPDPRYKISNEYIQTLLNYVDVKKYLLLINKLGSTKLLIFSIKQPNGVITVLGLLLEKCAISTDNGFCTLKSVNQIIPVYIERVDKQYLMTRSSGLKNLFSEKKILLIGCGSIGGYIANELAKAGIENMMLVDPDRLYETNIFRHLLGLEYVNQYKCVAVQTYLSKNIPDLKLSSLAENIEDAVWEEEIEFEQYDIVISATGNHNVNRWINQFVYENRMKVPIVYAWNEVLGIGNHIAYIEYGNNGCYECFLGRNEETGELYDRTSYCEPGQDIVQSVAGCGSAFIPYGSTVSLKTATMCVDVVKKIFEGRYKDNMIISMKGDDYYLLKAGLKVSSKYLNQKNNIVEYSGAIFVDTNCECCGVKNGNSR